MMSLAFDVLGFFVVATVIPLPPEFRSIRSMPISTNIDAKYIRYANSVEILTIFESLENRSIMASI